MYLSIKQELTDAIIIDLDRLKDLNVAGVAGGEIWISGGSPSGENEYESMEWESQLIKIPGSITISLLDSAKTTKINDISIEKTDNLEEKVQSLMTEMSELKKEFEKRKINKKHPKMKTHRFVLLKENNPLFSYDGTHLQFDIEWHLGTECKLTVWGQKTYTLKEEKSYEVILGSEEYVLRFES